MRGGLAPLVVVYVLDAFILGQGGITLLVSVAMELVAVIDIVRGVAGVRPLVRRGAITMLAYLALVAGVFGTIRANNALARSRTEQIVAELVRYHAHHGRYPERLGDLVPQYLRSIPVPKYMLMFNRFEYRSTGGDDATIGYTAMPPFGRPFYRLKTRTWGYLD